MAADPELVAALGATDLFSSLNKRSLNQLANLAHQVHHPAGTAVTEEGKGGIGFHLVTAGTASVTIDGQLQTRIGPGDYFGEISLIDGKPRSATVTADTDLDTASITFLTFKPLLERDATMANVLLQTMCARLRRRG